MSIRTRLLSSLGLYLVLVLLVLGGICLGILSHDIAASLDKRAEVTATNLANGLVEPLAKNEQDRINQLLLAAKASDQDIVYAHLTSSEGKVLASTDPSQKNQTLNRANSDRDATTLEGSIKRASLKAEEFEVLTPIVGQGANTLRIGFSTREIAAARIRSAQYIVMVGGVALVLGFVVFGRILKNTVLDPMARVGEQAQLISQGDLRDFVYASSDDEVGDLQKCMQSMTEYLREVASNADRIADGDLRVSTRTRSENDVFGAALAKMVQSMRAIIKQLAEGAQSLSSAASQMVETSRSQGSSILEQASAIQEILATIEQIRITVKQASEMAGSVVEISELSLDESRAGQQALETSVEAMHKIREQVEAIADNILDLSDKTVQIGEITASVNDIAEQSNLLAVNAAIEAARAGEAGKSFGVVATEVKNLAAQSKQATSQVRSILGEIQRAATSTVMVTEEGAKRADSGVEQVKQIGANFDRLFNVIHDSATAAKQIAAVTHHQVAGIEQITQAIREISGASDRSVVAAREQENTAQSLSSLASQMQTIVSRFSLSEERLG